MTDYTTIRIRKEVKDRAEGVKGVATWDEFISQMATNSTLASMVMTSGGEKVEVKEYPSSFVVGSKDPILEEILEKVSFLYSDRKKYGNGVMKQGNGRGKSLDSILLEFDQWAGVYLGGWSGKARDYTEGHLKAVRGWLEGLSLDTETVSGLGGE